MIGNRIMPKQSMNQDDLLEDFVARQVKLKRCWKNRVCCRVRPRYYRQEMPEICPEVARFARWVCDDGFTAFMPSLFGRDGAVPDADQGAAVFRKA